MKLKKGDKVIVLTGSEKGSTGVIENVLKERNRVIVNGVNKKKINKKPIRKGEKGEVIVKEFSIHVSNVSALDKNKKPSKIGFKGSGRNKTRFLKTTKEELKTKLPAKKSSAKKSLKPKTATKK